MIVMDPATRMLVGAVGAVVIVVGLYVLAEVSLPAWQRRRRRVPLFEVRSGHVDQPLPPQARHANPGQPRRVAGQGPACVTPMDGLAVLGRPYLDGEGPVRVWACGLCFDGADVVGDECVHCGRKHPRLAAR